MTLRQDLVIRTMVDLADNLVDDFDVVDLLTLLVDRCVEALDVTAAGILLQSPEGDLRVMASSSDALRSLEAFELQADEGPCLDCFRTGALVIDPDLATDGRWPRFRAAARDAGFGSAAAVPMRLRGTTIGALNTFAAAGPLGADDIAVAQALADVATIAILQDRVAHEAQIVNEQLGSALNSRITIEQAKGVLAEQGGTTVEAAFHLLRRHARDHGLRLVEVAAAVVAGEADATSLARPDRRSP